MTASLALFGGGPRPAPKPPEPADLSADEAAVLLALALSARPRTAGALARRARLPEPRARKALRALEGRGLAREEGRPRGNESVWLTTPAGSARALSLEGRR